MGAGAAGPRIDLTAVLRGAFVRCSLFWRDGAYSGGTETDTTETPPEDSCAKAVTVKVDQEGCSHEFDVAEALDKR